MNTPTRSFELPARPGSPADFVDYARSLLIGRSILSNALHFADTSPIISPKVGNILRSAVSAGTTTSADWASGLVDYRTIEAAFAESLRSISAFDRLLPTMRRVPLKARIVVSTVAVVAGIAPEAQPKKVGQLSLQAGDITPVKAALILAVSRELAEAAGAAGMALISAELRAAVAAGSDAAFIAALSAGLTPLPSTGTDAAGVAADLAALLAAVTTGAGSSLFLLLSPTRAKIVATMTGTDGHFAFPEMGPNGGSIAGIPTVVSDAVPDDAVILIDASRVVAGADPIVLDSSTTASIELDDDPSLPPGTLISLFQQNLLGLRGERMLTVKPLDGSVALMAGVVWGVP